MTGQHSRSEALFYYLRLEDQAPETHLLRLIEKQGEWRGGVSPPRSLRTGREPLGSSGSRYPAVRIEKRPVRKELWVHLDDTGEPLTRAFRLLLEALVFAV